MATIDAAESNVHDEQEKTDNGGSLCHFHPTDNILEIKSVIIEPGTQRCTLQRRRESEREIEAGRQWVGWGAKGELYWKQSGCFH